jgi:tellurite resistance protein
MPSLLAVKQGTEVHVHEVYFLEETDFFDFVLAASILISRNKDGGYMMKG